MSKGDDKKPNLVRLDEQLWGRDDQGDPDCSSAGEKRAGFIFQEDGDWFGSDRYIIMWLLGKGGMCEVWLARDRHMDSDDPRSFVAIKVLQSKLEIDDKSRKRLKAEALAFMKIKDDLNLPRVYYADVDPERDLFYYVMEYLRGETLEERIRRTGPLPLAKAMHIVASVTEAVQVIHDMGIIHRDLKPENIFLTEDGRVVLLDLGVAKFDEERFPNRSTFRTDDASIAGTFAYMSPEQSLGEKLDARSDIYALGVIAYCCISGRHPAQETPGGWMPNGYRAWSGWHINNQPKSLLLVVPGLPANVWTVISKAIEKDRSLRFATAAELAIEFRDIECTADEIDLLTLPPEPRCAPSAEATTQPQASTLPAKSPRDDTAALATTERTEQDLSTPLSIVEAPDGASTPEARDPNFDPRSRSHRPHTGPRSLVLLPPSSEAPATAPRSPNGTEIITPPPRSSAAASSRAASGTEIISVPSRASQAAPTPAPARPAEPQSSRAAPPAEPRRSVAPGAPPDQQRSSRAEDLKASPPLAQREERSREQIGAPSRTRPSDEPKKTIAQALRSTPSAQAVPIVAARPPEKPRPFPRRIAAFGAGGLAVGLAVAALVAALVKPNGARATASAAAPSAAQTVPTERPSPPGVAISAAPSMPVSAAPPAPQTAKTAGASTAFTGTSTARQAPRTAPALRPTTTTPKPKSDRVVD